MGLVDHAEYELKIAGYNVDKKKDINTDQDYADEVGRSALELIKVFAKQGHSGMSAQFTLKLFNRLAQHKALTELTDNPDEWQDLSSYIGTGEKCYQSKRQSSCFSRDLKTYYDIDDPDNNIYGKDGDATYSQLKPENERKILELKHFEVI